VPRKKSRPTNYLTVNGSFLQLPHKTILSREYQSLKYSTRCIYEVLLTRWNREKDKSEREYPFSYREIQEIMGIDRRVIADAIKELEDKDFIYVSRHWNNIPSTYRPVLKWLV
jgi:DNA-binding MarR family transcriptional regulator